LLPPLYFESFTKKKPQKFKFQQFGILIPYPEIVDQSWDDDHSKIEDEADGDVDMQDGDADMEGGVVHCGCETGCSTRRCGCKKTEKVCSESCSCHNCQNHI